MVVGQRDSDIRRRPPQQAPAQASQIPVLVVPPEITYIADTVVTHKQTLTLYNPYDFPMKFKVMTTSPDLFSVRDSSGVLPARSSAIVVVKLCSEHVPVKRKDKLKVEMTNESQTTSGQKIIPIVVKPTTGNKHVSMADGVGGDQMSNRGSTGDLMGQNSGNATNKAKKRQGRPTMNGQEHRNHSLLSLTPLILGLISIIWMQSSDPWSLPESMKLWVAFAAGLVTMFCQIKVWDEMNFR
eukprot:GFYU01002783.1.p1 GENE.GFYU01002783.1~~GFYU01002783.1.p1  ORF type:complete len:240 (-),score=41.25 GFYU01002783.1:82-801(-)